MGPLVQNEGDESKVAASVFSFPLMSPISKSDTVSRDTGRAMRHGAVIQGLGGAGHLTKARRAARRLAAKRSEAREDSEADAEAEIPQKR